MAITVIGRHFDPHYSEECGRYSDRAHKLEFNFDTCVDHQTEETPAQTDPLALWTELTGTTLTNEQESQFMSRREFVLLNSVAVQVLRKAASMAMGFNRHRLPLSDWLHEVQALQHGVAETDARESARSAALMKEMDEARRAEKAEAKELEANTQRLERQRLFKIEEAKERAIQQSKSEERDRTRVHAEALKVATAEDIPPAEREGWARMYILSEQEKARLHRAGTKEVLAKRIAEPDRAEWVDDFVAFEYNIWSRNKWKDERDRLRRLEAAKREGVL